MEANKKVKILEALQMQPLSEEEKASRHILGRLYGPIATTKEKTRNGRGYNKELWEKALTDEIFKEKIANKSLFLELGHPLDREETDMEKVCACIPEMPKIVDGDLYAYVDILDTNNGRLLKTLCDYGFVPGISSRGSGDIMSNDEVDPETFFLETWDIVQLPAVKKARLSMCESLGTKTLSMALRESLAKASEEEKKEITETLNKLNIQLTEEVNLDEVPFAPDPEEDDLLLEETEDELVDEVEEVVAEEGEVEIAEDEAVEGFTVKTLIQSLSDYADDLNVEFKPIVIEDKEYEITSLDLEDSDEGKLVVSIGYSLPEEVSEEEDNILPEDENPAADVEVSSEEEPQPEETAEDSEEAVDDGDEEVFESLKEMVRQKDLLETEIRDLKNQKTVSDAEVRGLKEELEKYKSGFMRVSELASKSSSLEKEVKSLSEQLEQKNAKLNDLQTKVEKQTKLTESVNANETKVKALTEKLIAVQTEAEKVEEELKAKLTESKKAINKNASIAKSYKAKYDAIVERYITSKANMLGVRAYDITSRLAESYTLDDIDQVCEDLLDMGRPTFGIGLSKPKVKINEAKDTKKIKGGIDDDGYEDLLILAGLK